MKKRSFNTLLILAGLVLLAFTGCETIKNTDTGSLKISITDSPFPIEMISDASVTITKIEVRMVSDTSDTIYKTVYEDTVTVNLLDLRNGVTEDLSEVELEAGTYDLVRIYVSDASLTVIGGETYDLKVPSGSQTGIKVFISPAVEVAGGLSSELLLDFDLQKSFVLKGNYSTPAGIKGFNFKPVVRAVNNSTAGSIAGIVSIIDSSAVINGASVWVVKDSTLATALTDSTGFYAFAGIPAGAYSVYATAANYDTVFFEGVNVVAGNKTTLDFELTEKE